MLLGTASTLAETLALVVIARVAVAVTTGDDKVRIGPGLSFTGLAALGVAAAALVLKLGLSAGAAWLGARLSAETVRTGRVALLNSYFAADWRQQSQERTGELQDYLTTSVGRLNGVNQSFISGLNALVSFVVVTVVAVAVNPLAAVGCALAAAILVLLLRPLSRRTKRYSWAQSDATRELAAEATESVRLSQEVRVFGVRSAVLARLELAEGRASRPLQLGNFTQALAPSVYQSLALLFLLLSVGAVQVVGRHDVSSLGAAVVLLLRGLGYGQQLQNSIQSLANTLPFLDALHERKRTYDSERERAGHLPLPSIGRLELRGVGFAYVAGQPVLADLDVAFSRTESIGIVGPSGSGKSTLLQLLLRLRAPTTGNIFVDGEDIWDVSAEAWSRRVAFVPQEGRLLDDTVAENIRFYRDLSQEQVERAARAAHIHEEVLSWPDGYRTVVGDGGNRISGGQRQRIAIARALAGSPDLLVLDEPTSALDLISEARLQGTLDDLRGTVGLIIVAHRLSTVSRCDKILVLRAGRCEAYDGHLQLLETSAFYRDAVELSMLRPAAADALAGQGKREPPAG